MPSVPHEVTIEFFRNRPQLAKQLLSRNLQIHFPDHDARFDSADLSQVQPTEYRADGVVTLTHPTDGSTALGIVVEVQRQISERKRYTWPVYVTTLRARLKCPVFLLIVSYHEGTARWCAQPIDLGGGSILPCVIGPADVPFISDVQQARANPELAVLSVMAHGQDRDVRRAAAIADVACQAVTGLDDDKAVLYLDVILASLSGAARLELQTMIPDGYEFQSEFVRTHFNNARQEGLAKGHAEGMAKGWAEGLTEGRAEGLAEGRTQIVMKQLEIRYGTLPPPVRALVSGAGPVRLEGIAQRLLTASTLEEALGEASAAADPSAGRGSAGVAR